MHFFRHTAALYLNVVVLWGLTWYAIHLQLGVVPIGWSIAYRFFLAGLCMVLIAKASGKSLRFPRRLHGWLALQGLCLFAFNFFLMYHGTAYVPSGVLSVVFSTIVMMNTFLGILLLGAPASKRLWAGAVLGILGIGLVFLPDIRAVQAGSQATTGLLLGFAGTFLASLGNLISAKLQKEKIAVIPATGIAMLYGALAMTLTAVVSGETPVIEWTLPYIGSLLFLVIFGSVIAFTSYLTLIGRLGAGKAAYATILCPLIALLVSTLLEHYHWAFEARIGIPLILLGNLLALLKREQIDFLRKKLQGKAHGETTHP